MYQIKLNKQNKSISLTKVQRSVELTQIKKNITLKQTGRRGPQGEPGVGVPTGGTAGQVLAKDSNTDYDTEWVDQTGGVASVNGQTGEVTLDAEDVGALESVVAGDNITIDDTDPLNPVINSSGGGAELAIGSPVTDSTPGRMLSVDSGGNLTDSAFIAEEENLFGFLPASKIGSPLAANAAVYMLDGTPLGGSETLAISTTSGNAFNLSILDIDNFNTYQAISKSSSDVASFIFSPYGTNSPDTSGRMLITPFGMQLSGTGAFVSSFDDDDTLAANASNRVATQKAVKTYVDNEIATIPSSSPGGSDGEVQYNNGGIFGGTGVYFDDTAGFPNLGIGISTPIAPLHIAASPGASSSNSVGSLVLDLFSEYTGGSQQSAAFFRVTSTDSSGSGYTGLFGVARTGSGDESVSLLAGFQGEVQARNSSGTVVSAVGGAMRVSNSGGGIISNAYGMSIFNALNLGGGSITNNYGLYVYDQTVGGSNYAIYTGRGDIRLMSDDSDKLSFYGVTPLARQTLSTGTSKTVDDVIAALQNIGLVKQ